MTRCAQNAELEVERRDDYNRYISLNAASPETNYEAADRVARALIRFFDMHVIEEFGDDRKYSAPGSLAVWVVNSGTSARAIVHCGLRRVLVELPAADFAFDGETGAALAEARTWLAGDDRSNLDSVGYVLEIRAILHDKTFTRQRDEDIKEAMNEFGITYPEADCATYFVRHWHRQLKGYIREGFSENAYEYRSGMLYTTHWDGDLCDEEHDD